jgi:hypothetical protein
MIERAEECELCNAPTGKAGACEDSLFLWDRLRKREAGPLCEDCYRQSLGSGDFEECE